MNTRAALVATALISGGAAAQAPDNAALASFERIARACQASYAAQPPEDVAFVKSSGKWAKRARSRAEISYDVQRTSSLVTPFQGVLLVKQQLNSDRADSEAAARALQVAAAGGLVLLERLEFAYQGNRWVLTGGQSDAGGSVGRRDAASYRQDRTPIVGCLGD